MSNKAQEPKAKQVVSPQIDFLNPATVQANWEGTVKIGGSGFDNNSFALFDGAVPQTISADASLLRVAVTKEITKQVGRKTVLVHTGAGDESNAVEFTVT